MPSWGRPPGARGSRRRRQWEYDQAYWQEQARVEELESDDTDTHGVGLNFKEKRFASDPLQFTGIDLASATRTRKKYAYDDTDTSDESSDSLGEDDDGAMQIVMRDKEEALVQSALARIRRAEEKGKREVRLNQDELDALAKRRKRMQSAATAKSKKKSSSGSGSDHRRKSERHVVSLPIASVEPISRKSKSRRSDDIQAAAPAPGMLIAGPDGPMYAPFGYNPAKSNSTRNSPSRPRSATNRELRGTPPPFPFPQGQAGRHFSDGTRPGSSASNSSRRPLPDDEDWVPSNSRRSSVSSQYADPFLYQTSSEQPPPIPPQFIQPTASGRRNNSGPAEVNYASVRRTPPIGGYASNSRGTHSDQSLSRRHEAEVPDSQGSSSSVSTEESSDDPLGNGVQVFVEEREPDRSKSVVSRKPVGGRKKGKGR
ncbi:hypothetical protein BP5796_10682 [Coleophoma crateriformis]|uniref:Prenylated rab acceptor 1 n=1 Tax=Coleophoma crateriformis TaxID=565419 RepID=A0A3D8QRB0_9HELO|nr:hypothetical protein BP5796_10682 [Coleophoma crateriformis]